MLDTNHAKPVVPHWDAAANVVTADLYNFNPEISRSRVNEIYWFDE